jgi:hypothetical protein
VIDEHATTAGDRLPALAQARRCRSIHSSVFGFLRI